MQRGAGRPRAGGHPNLHTGQHNRTNIWKNFYCSESKSTEIDWPSTSYRLRVSLAHSAQTDLLARSEIFSFSANLLPMRPLCHLAVQMTKCAIVRQWPLETEYRQASLNCRYAEFSQICRSILSDKIRSFRQNCLVARENSEKKQTTSFRNHHRV